MIKNFFSQEEGVRTVSQIIESGGRAYFFLCNVAKSDEVKLCAQQIFSNTKIGVSVIRLTVTFIFCFNDSACNSLLRLKKAKNNKRSSTVA